MFIQRLKFYKYIYVVNVSTNFKNILAYHNLCQENDKLFEGRISCIALRRTSKSLNILKIESQKKM